MRPGKRPQQPHQPFELLLRCLKSYLHQKPLENNSETALTTDWESFTNQVFHHKVTAFVLLAFQQSPDFTVPDTIQAQLKAHQSRNQRRLLSLSHELSRVCNTLHKFQIFALALKGPLLSKQLYNDVAMRESKDIDIWVAPEHLKHTHEILHSLDYTRTVPGETLTPKQHAHLIKNRKDFTYFNASKRVCLELHWRLFATPFRVEVSANEMRQYSQTALLGTQEVNCLSADMNLLYLCSHGFQTTFHRLIWLLDVAVSMQQRGTHDDGKSLLELAQQKNTLKNLSAAICLAAELLGSSIPDAFRNLSKCVKPTRSLIVGASTYIANSPGIFSPVKRTGAKALNRIYREHVSRPDTNWRIKAANFKSLFVHDQEDWRILPMPDSLFALYYPLRPFLYFWRKCM